MKVGFYVICHGDFKGSPRCMMAGNQITVTVAEMQLPSKAIYVILTENKTVFVVPLQNE
jgi:hypothetical protein